MSKRSIFFVLIASVLAVFLPATAAAQAQAAADPLPLRVISHNLAGAANGNGGKDDSANIFDVTRREIESFEPQIVMLQEVCYHRELPYFRDFTTPLGYSSAFTHIRSDYTACLTAAEQAAIRSQYGLPANGDVCAPEPTNCYYGEVLAVKGTLRNPTATAIGGNYPADSSTQRRFRLLCGDVAVAGIAPLVHACTTQLRANFPGGSGNAGCTTGGVCDTAAQCTVNDRCSRGKQTAAIASLLAAEADDKVIAFGGDLNSTPGLAALDPFYRPALGGTGNYYEADQTDDKYFPSGCDGPSCRSGGFTERGSDETFTLKYDYVFFRAPTLTDLSYLSARCGYDPYSDHGVYRAQVRYQGVGANAPGATPATAECGS